MKIKTKTLKAWVAMNKNEFDVQNMSFLRTKKEAIRRWGKLHQYITPIKIIFTDLK